jgi:hypothetical protein
MRTSRLAWKFLWLPVVCAAAALALTLSSTAAGGSHAGPPGPCVPVKLPGVKLPPGVPKPPPCKKPGKSNIELKVSGGVTISYSAHSGPWGHCTAAQGGGAHTDASTEANFGQSSAEPATATFDKNKLLAHIDATPSVEMTLTPNQVQKHEVPPGCTVTKDPTGCRQVKTSGEVTVHGSIDQHLIRVTLHEPTAGFVVAQCAAPWVGANIFQDLAFTHELDEVDEGALAHVGNKASTIKKATIEWVEKEAPCSDFGGPKDGAPALDGAIDICRIKGDFRVQVMRLS